jgi:PhoPQ-activated pathogenicity-related protein
MKWNSPLSRYLIALLTALSAFALHADEPSTSPLRQYVETPDSSYSYRLVNQWSGDGFDAYYLNMNSQSWRSSAEVSPVVWNHWVTIIVPQQLTTNTANLVILGGHTSAQPPDPEELTLFVPIATATGAVQVILEQVPAMPLYFTGLSEGLTEDSLVAYSWKRVMETGDPTWAVHLPMTKAVVRTMDTAQDFITTTLGFGIDNFIVTGFSKRGATAWLTAAVDSRVVAVAPGDLNILNIANQLEHHYSSYGFFSDALSYYELNGILEGIRSPEGKLLAQIIDPISYKDTLTMPHLILNASGDEFFIPDASEGYVHELPAEVLQRIVPNTNHIMDGMLEEVLSGLVAWYQVQLHGVDKPNIEWHLAPSGELEVSSDQPPLVAKLWQATNPSARDFRHEIVGNQAWQNSLISADADGIYRVTVPAPSEGYTAYMVELTYPGVADIPQVYTTSVFITPDELPFELEDPLLEPKHPLYWNLQVKRALWGIADDYTIAELEMLLPIRVLGSYIHDVNTLDAYLNGSAARQACSAARLNVEAQEVGWYTTLYTFDEVNIKYWQPYDMAERLYSEGKERQASAVCWWLTLQ